MSWNYRVMRETVKGERLFSIHEVYYDEAGFVKAWSVDAVKPGGETYKALTQDFTNYQRAFAKPVIDVRDDGLFEIGPMGNSKPVRVWEPAPEVSREAQSEKESHLLSVAEATNKK